MTAAHALTWRLQALCRTMDPDLFYSDKPDDQIIAVNTCWLCPARLDCFDYATNVKTRQDFGVWGGTTPAERRQIRVPRVRIKCPHCGPGTRIFGGNDETPAAICLSCGLSWRTR